MAILANTAFSELTAAITDEPGGEVELALAGLEYKYSVYISTVGAAIAELRAIADWLERRDADG